jgi:LemA protein
LRRIFGFSEVLSEKEGKMANELDEITGPVNPEGRDVNVIEKQLKVEIGAGTKFFELALWVGGILVAGIIGIASTGDPAQGALFAIAGVIPGLIFQFMKQNALAYFRKLQQKIQADASQIDTFLEQRVVILQNLTRLLDKSIDLDKDVMKTVAAYRGGVNPQADAARNEATAAMDGIQSRINLAFEAYPELRAQENINDAMRQNSTLQKEITAARVLYNDSVAMWNQDIFTWPTKIIVAAKQGYTTRIPYTVGADIKAQARGTFF